MVSASEGPDDSLGDTEESPLTTSGASTSGPESLLATSRKRKQTSAQYARERQRGGRGAFGKSIDRLSEVLDASMRSRESVITRAIMRLQSEYTTLAPDRMASAIDGLSNKSAASVFMGLNDGGIRDRWVEALIDRMQAMVSDGYQPDLD